MKKKILLASVLLVVMLGIMTSVKAFDYNVTIEASKTTVAKNEEFTVNVNVSNIVSDMGVISFGGTLDYDKESLELVKIEGKNDWETPKKGSTYNESDGLIAITRNGVTKNNETIFTITFKSKENAKPNVEIKLTDVMVADGSTPVKKALVKQNITVTEVIPTATPSPSPSTIPTAKPTPTPVNKLPKTGEGSVEKVFIFGGAVTIAVAIFFFVEMKLLRKG